MSNSAKAKGVVTAELRKSDGVCIARDLFATYPVRLHLTSRPNQDTFHQSHGKPICDGGETEGNRSKNEQKALCCYVLGYGGGLVSGDFIDLEFKVNVNASLVITSQSTSKAFKALPNRDATFVRTNVAVDLGGLLVLVPQPTQCFAQSKFIQETNVSMKYLKQNSNMINFEKKGEKRIDSVNSSILLVDWYTGGRENLDNGNWKLDSFRSSTSISFVESNDKLSISTLVFRDATRLFGGLDLQHHMRDFNVVCMVVLIGTRVQSQSKRFLQKFSSRHSFHDDIENNSKRLDQKHSINKLNQRPTCPGRNYTLGEGLNGEDGLLISCGTFPLPSNKESEEGVVLRLASNTIEQAASFLSEHLGTLDGQLEDDPFLEILVSRQTAIHLNPNKSSMKISKEKESNDILSYGLLNTLFMEKNQKNKKQKLTKFHSDKMNPVSSYQLVDSSTPTGGFAHSNTVEVAHQLNFIDNSVSSTHTLVSHVWEVMLQSCTSLLPFLVSSCTLFQNYEEKIQSHDSATIDYFLDEWEKLDFNLNATLTSHVSRRASVVQGSGMLRAYIQIFPHIAIPLKRIKKRVLEASTSGKFNSFYSFCVSGHAATCFGAVCGLLGMDIKTCSSMFLYTSARDMINAAVRMNLVGPLEAGRLINNICCRLDVLVDNMICDHDTDNHQIESTENNLDPSSAHQICPLLEILANAHDRLYTRLFNS